MTIHRIRSALVFAAGLGTRMRPLTNDTPKPLVKVAGKALIDWSVEMLVAHGIENIVVNTSYKAEMLVDHITSKYGSAVKISIEPEPLETGGGVINALPLLGNEPIITLNGDVIFINSSESILAKLEQMWFSNHNLDALLVLHNYTSNSVGYDGKGDFFMDKDGGLSVGQSGEIHPYVFAGMQILRPKALEVFHEKIFSLNKLYKSRISPNNKLTDIKGLENTGTWYHIGTIQGLEDATKSLLTAESWDGERL
jgi:MurNAc alpha-1-phosphate uridylyltransferase